MNIGIVAKTLIDKNYCILLIKEVMVRFHPCLPDFGKVPIPNSK